jgi:hypothetical protein
MHKMSFSTAVSAASALKAPSLTALRMNLEFYAPASTQKK